MTGPVHRREPCTGRRLRRSFAHVPGRRSVAPALRFVSIRSRKCPRDSIPPHRRRCLPRDNPGDWNGLVRWLRRSRRGQRRGRQMVRQGWQSNLQGRKREGRFLQLQRLRPLFSELFAMPWARRPRLDLCAVASRVSATTELWGLSRRRGERQEGCFELVKPGDAVARRKPERDVLPRRDFHLSACTLGWRDRTRTSGGSRAETGGVQQSGRRVHGVMRAMRWTIVALEIGCVLLPRAAGAQQPGLGGAVELVDPKVLRVCADPNNLPFSNEAKEGFENKIAALVGEKLGKPVAYTYYPQVIGFVRATLHAFRCAVVMGGSGGDDLVQ